MRKAAPPVLLTFILLAAAAVILGLYNVRKRVSHRPNSFSTSFVGHRATIELLRRSNFDVQINQRVDPGINGTETEVGLAVLCPRIKNFGKQVMRRISGRGIPPEEQYSWERLQDKFQHQLIVLPKWIPKNNKKQPNWITEKNLMPANHVSAYLKEGAPETIKRPSSSKGSRTVRFDRDKQFKIYTHGLQVFPEDPDFEVVASVEGKPVAVRDRNHSSRIWVSDPDTFSNQFLGNEDNAPFVYEIFSTAFPNGRVFVDEVHHGFIVNHTIGEIVFTFPGVILTGDILLLIGLFYWALYNKWGGRKKVVAEERSRIQQAENAGELAHRHGDHQKAVMLYLQNVLDYIRESLNISRGNSLDEIEAYFERLKSPLTNRIRELRSDIRMVEERQPSKEQLVQIARRANRLMKEVRNETGQKAPHKPS